MSISQTWKISKSDGFRLASAKLPSIHSVSTLLRQLGSKISFVIGVYGLLATFRDKVANRVEHLAALLVL